MPQTDPLLDVEAQVQPGGAQRGGYIALALHFIVRPWCFFVPELPFVEDFYATAFPMQYYAVDASSDDHTRTMLSIVRAFCASRNASKVQAHNRSVHQRGYIMLKFIVIAAFIGSVAVLDRDTSIHQSYVLPWTSLLDFKEHPIFPVCVYVFLASAVTRPICTMCFNGPQKTFKDTGNPDVPLWLDWINVICALIEIISLKTAASYGWKAIEPIKDGHASMGIMYLQSMRMFITWHQMIVLLRPRHARVALLVAELSCFIVDGVTISWFHQAGLLLAYEFFNCILTVLPIWLVIHYTEHLHAYIEREISSRADFEPTTDRGQNERSGISERMPMSTLVIEPLRSETPSMLQEISSRADFEATTVRDQNERAGIGEHLPMSPHETELLRSETPSMLQVTSSRADFEGTTVRDQNECAGISEHMPVSPHVTEALRSESPSMLQEATCGSVLDHPPCSMLSIAEEHNSRDGSWLPTSGSSQHYMAPSSQPSSGLSGRAALDEERRALDNLARRCRELESQLEDLGIAFYFANLLCKSAEPV